MWFSTDFNVPNTYSMDSLKQNASRIMLIFMKILEMYLKVKYCEVNK
jgi:hypothetical protein